MRRKRKSKYISFERCKIFAQSLGVRTKKEWINTIKPKNMPDQPDVIYLKKGWTNWYDFLGKEKGGDAKEYMSYEEAEAWVRKKGIKSIREFRNARRVPYNFPCEPAQKYRGKGWISWMYFFGKIDKDGNLEPLESKYGYKKNFVSYEEARKTVIAKGIKSRREFENWSRRPYDIPAIPNKYYQGKGWQSWFHFLDKEPKRGRPVKKKVVES